MSLPSPPRDPGLQPERTALAWQRTGLALAGASVVVARLTFSTVGVLAVVDHGAWSPPTEQNRIDSREDASLVADLLERVPDGSLVAQLPVVSFPDDVGADRLLAPAVHAGDHLRFTAGAFRGGPGDWQESWLAGDPEAASNLRVRVPSLKLSCSPALPTGMVTVTPSPVRMAEEPRSLTV